LGSYGEPQSDRDYLNSLEEHSLAPLWIYLLFIGFVVLLWGYAHSKFPAPLARDSWFLIVAVLFIVTEVVFRFVRPLRRLAGRWTARAGPAARRTPPSRFLVPLGVLVASAPLLMATATRDVEAAVTPLPDIGRSLTAAARTREELQRIIDRLGIARYGSVLERLEADVNAIRRDTKADTGRVERELSDVMLEIGRRSDSLERSLKALELKLDSLDRRQRTIDKRGPDGAARH